MNSRYFIENVNFDTKASTFDVAVLVFGMTRTGNFLAAGSTMTTMRFEDTPEVRELQEKLFQCGADGHRGPVSVRMNGEDVVLDETLWPGIGACLGAFIWERDLTAAGFPGARD